MTGHELEQNDSVPDLVVERGRPPLLITPNPPGPSGRGLQDPRWAAAVLGVVLFGPVFVAFFVRAVTTRGPWSPNSQLMIVTVLATMAALWFFDRMEKRKAAHAQLAGPAQIDDENFLAAIGIGFLALAECVAIASFELLAGLALLALLIAWILLSSLPPLRRIEVRSSVQVACRAEAAFGLVADPQSWRLWAPEIELVEAAEVPIRIGTVIRSRARPAAWSRWRNA